jgi:hypothetical protein
MENKDQTLLEKSELEPKLEIDFKNGTYKSIYQVVIENGNLYFIDHRGKTNLGDPNAQQKIHLNAHDNPLNSPKEHENDLTSEEQERHNKIKQQLDDQVKKIHSFVYDYCKTNEIKLNGFEVTKEGLIPKPLEFIPEIK